MTSVFDDPLYDVGEMTIRAQLQGGVFREGLQSGELNGQYVLNLCAQVRANCSVVGQRARFVLGANDMTKLAGDMKHMAKWLNTAEAAGKNLLLSPDSATDQVNASRYMSLLYVWDQVLRQLFPAEEEK